MFRFGRTELNENVIRWSQLLPLLEDDDRRAAIERSFPESGRESFLWGLKRVEPDAAARLIAAGRQLEAAAPLAEHPTIAVAGMLNGGKTSLVASFLSPLGRQRSLRGDSNYQGTHRFVLWLPQSWREDAELWSLLLTRIGDALGSSPELLADNPEEAHRQYNNLNGGVDALSIPLVAVDPGLDQHGVGLLDCPDIVSAAAFGRGTPETRRLLLRRAATLCSAFIVVSGAESIRDQTLGELLRSASELMPGVPRLLAVNKVRPGQTPDAVWANTRELVRLHQIDDVLVAYDFLIPACEPFIPITDHDSDRSPDEEPLPVFYRLREEPEDNPPATISEQRLLSALPAQLDHAELFHQVRLALELRLTNAIWDDGVEVLKRAAEESKREAVELRELLFEACLEFFARRQPGGKILELRLHQNERIVRQLTSAFAEAAPWYARFGMRMNSRLRKIWGGASDLIARLTPSKIAASTADSIKEKIRSGKQGSILTAERMSDTIGNRMDILRLPGIDSVEMLTRRCERAIDRFDQEDFTALDPARLQAAVAEVWRQMPISKKMKAGLTPLVIVFAAFGAALMIPIDFGGTGIVFAASIKELFLAAGVSLAGAAWGGGLVLVDIEQQAARQQISNFLAVLCDVLAVPRWHDRSNAPTIRVAENVVRLPDPTVSNKPAVEAQSAIVQWNVRDEFLKELQQHVKQPK